MHTISRLLFCGIKSLSANYTTVANRDLMSHLHFYQQSQNYSDLRKSDLLLANIKAITHWRSMGTSFKIKHDDNRFFIETKEGVAQLKYEINDGVMDIKHTGVPRALGGHGIGKLLAKVFVYQVH